MRIRFAVLAAALLFPQVAFAQTSGDVAAADALFDQGQKLMKEGKPAEACPKLEESLRLEVTTGTLFLLADCLEKSGRTASAWARFRDLQELVKKRGKVEREQEAAGRVRALEPKVPKMRIDVAPATASVPGLEVRKNGVLIGRGAWGSDLPEDPGEVAVEATAPGKRPWKMKQKIAIGQSVAVQVPALEDEAKAASTPPAPTSIAEPVASPPAATNDPGSTQRFVGYGIGGLGLVGVAVGGIFLASASSKQSEITTADGSGKCVNGGCDSLVSDRNGKATVAYIGLIAGGAALIGGLVVVLTAPSDGRAVSVRFAPASGGGIAGIGGFF